MKWSSPSRPTRHPRFSSCADGESDRRWGCSISIPIQLTQGDVHDHCLSRHRFRQERISPARFQCHRPGVSGTPERAARLVAGVANEWSPQVRLSSGSAAPEAAVKTGCGFSVRTLFFLSVVGFTPVGRLFLILFRFSRRTCSESFC